MPAVANSLVNRTHFAGENKPLFSGHRPLNRDLLNRDLEFARAQLVSGLDRWTRQNVIPQVANPRLAHGRLPA
jgi:hypothetical protein